jgi:hypothetical protein
MDLAPRACLSSVCHTYYSNLDLICSTSQLRWYVEDLVLFGAGDQVRTDDIFLGKEVLYQLSYTRMCIVFNSVVVARTRIELVIIAYQATVIPFNYPAETWW